MGFLDQAVSAFGGMPPTPALERPMPEPAIPLVRQPGRQYVPTQDLASKFGWITPDGTFWACHYYLHSAVADHFRPESRHPTIDVEAEGWLKVSWDNGCPRLVIFRSPTVPQADRLAEWCALHRVDESELEVRRWES